MALDRTRSRTRISFSVMFTLPVCQVSNLEAAESLALSEGIGREAEGYLIAMARAYDTASQYHDKMIDSKRASIGWIVGLSLLEPGLFIFLTASSYMSL